MNNAFFPNTSKNLYTLLVTTVSRKKLVTTAVVTILYHGESNNQPAINANTTLVATIAMEALREMFRCCSCAFLNSTRYIKIPSTNMARPVVYKTYELVHIF